MTARLILIGSVLILTLGCQIPASTAKSAVGSLTCREQCEEGTRDAVSETFNGRTLWFGSPQAYRLQYVAPSLDAAGQPAIAFEVEEAGKAEFTAMTERCVHRTLAFYIDGEFVFAPILHSALPGKGVIIKGSPGGWTEVERDAWLVRIKGS
jgi:preprotein translocase subunit SecD